MEDVISPARIANAIIQDERYSGYYLLVEGTKDIDLYSKFLTKDLVRIRPTFGKYKLRDVYDRLDADGFNRKLGIRDADFIRLCGNTKFDPNYSKRIFITDHHDADVMVIKHESLSEFLLNVSTAEKILLLENKLEKSITDILLDLAYKIGCLRLANKKFNLGLAFKPKNPEGNKLKYDKFISKDLVHLSDEILINYICEYSNNKTEKISPREIILEKLNLVLNEAHPDSEIVNGHDISGILFHILKNGLNCKDKRLQDIDCVERSLYLAFNLIHFSKTNLYSTIRSWENAEGISIFKTLPQ